MPNIVVELDGPPDRLFSRARCVCGWAAAHHGRCDDFRCHGLLGDFFRSSCFFSPRCFRKDGASTRRRLLLLLAGEWRPLHVKVVGSSWLYNLEAYRRLFPASYVATPRVLRNRFRSMPLWGQFLDRYGGLKEQMTRPFLAQLEQQTCVERLHACFPFQVLTIEAPVQEFYTFYGL